jgi:hypothetical protein
MAWWLIKYKNNFAQTEPFSSLLWLLIWGGASSIIFSPDNGHIMFQCIGLLSPTIQSLSLSARFRMQCKDGALSLSFPIFNPSNSCCQNGSLTHNHFPCDCPYFCVPALLAYKELECSVFVMAPCTTEQAEYSDLSSRNERRTFSIHTYYPERIFSCFFSVLSKKLPA